MSLFHFKQKIYIDNHEEKVEPSTPDVQTFPDITDGIQSENSNGKSKF